jgi:predicted O-methyltransferase YrrM
MSIIDVLKTFPYVERDADYLNAVDYYPFLNALAKDLKAKRVLEIGVRFGYSAVAFIYGNSIESYVGVDNDLYDLYINDCSDLVPSLSKARVNLDYLNATQPVNFMLLRKDTQDLTDLSFLGTTGFDFIHIDGDHSYEGAFTDIKNFWNVLAVGGHMLVDDSLFVPAVGAACITFAQMINEPCYNVKTYRGTWVFLKTKGRSFPISTSSVNEATIRRDRSGPSQSAVSSPGSLHRNSENALSRSYYYEESFCDAALADYIAPLVTLPTGEPDGATQQCTYLDGLPRIECCVGYGQIGLNGELGYEGKRVSVRARPDLHALSTHAPARALFKVDGQFSRLECFVALNDDVPANVSSADFTVFADRRLVGAALGVTAGDPPRLLIAELGSAQMLELTVETGHPEFCHSIWLNPRLFTRKPDASTTSMCDCLARTEIVLSPAIPSAERCIATVASSGFESLLDDMLGSLSTNGGCEDALLVVFCAGNPETVAPVVAKYRARLIQCRPIRPVGLTLKSVLYSVARVVDAEQYLCLDADMLVLRDLRPLFAMLHACPEGSILVCRENNSRRFRNLGDAFVRLYQGSPVEGSTLLDERLASYPLVVNDGLFAGTRAALLALDSTVRGMPQMQAWMDDRPEIRFRNQFIFNSALAESNCGIELDPVYNLQLQGCEMRMFREAGRIQAEWKNKRVAVAHFNGDGRHKYPEFRNRHSLMLNASPGT